MTTEFDTARDGIETVARFYEKTFLRGSPFNLSPCGGCGAPSFGQPCAICNYYPMGRDKGVYSPHDATFDNFSAAVDRSGPYGQGGNIATWYLASFRRTVAFSQPSYAARINEAIKEAAKLDLPAADLYWRMASRAEGGQLVPRNDRNRIELAAIWSVSDELMNRTTDFTLRGAVRPDLAADVKRVVGGWVEAAHDGDELGVVSAVEELQSTIGEIYAVTRDGNLFHAANRLGEELELRADQVNSGPRI